MVQVDFDSLRERGGPLDLEMGTNAVVNEEASPNRSSTNLLGRVWNGFVSSVRSSRIEDGSSGDNCSNHVDAAPRKNGEALVDKLFGGEELNPLEKKSAGDEKPKKKSCKKPPKPPRPPRAPSMDAADQKLMRELAELAMLKRARVERMRALKRTKNAKSTTSGSNLFALVITIIFCVVIIWQGLFPSAGSTVTRFQGSPVSSAAGRGGFISVQFYKNISASYDSSSASPNSVEPASGIDGNREPGSSRTRYVLPRI